MSSELVKYDWSSSGPDDDGHDSGIWIIILMGTLLIRLKEHHIIICMCMYLIPGMLKHPHDGHQGR